MKVKFGFEELHYLISGLTVLMVFQPCCTALRIGQCYRIQNPGKTLTWSNDFQNKDVETVPWEESIVIEQLDI